MINNDKRVLLCIMDGWGISQNKNHNAVYSALTPNYDEFINRLSDDKPISYKRWYDFSPELHSAVESMKNLPSEKNAELISMISDIVFKYTSKDFNETMENLISTRKNEEQNG